MPYPFDISHGYNPQVNAALVSAQEEFYGSNYNQQYSKFEVNYCSENIIRKTVHF